MIITMVYLSMACFHFFMIDNRYDAVSANVMIWVLQMGESESGQMVSEKVKWA